MTQRPGLPRGIGGVVRAVHCPFVGASVSEYHNSIVADFLAQASTANRLVCSDSGGIDRPLPCAGVFEQYSTGRKIFLCQARSFGRWARSARALGTCRRWVPARLRHNDIVFRFRRRDPEAEGRKVSRLGGMGGECSEAERSGGEGNKEGPDRHCGLRWSSWDGRPSSIVAAVAAL